MLCKGCLRDFACQGDLLHHQSLANTCRWVYEEHQAQDPAPKRDLTAVEMLEEDPPMEAENASFTMEDVPYEGDDEVPKDIHSNRQAMEDALDDEAIAFEDFPGAGSIYRKDADTNHQYKGLEGVEQIPYHPFSNKMEWEIAKWAKDLQQGETALTKLLSIPGVCFLVG